MEYSRVSSGYTKVIDEQRKDWYEKLGEEKLEWEDLAGAESTNDLLRMLGNVPLYRYLVNYLLSVWEGKDLEEIQRIIRIFNISEEQHNKHAMLSIKNLATFRLVLSNN